MAAPDAARGPRVVLDLSRLLSRVLHPTPTGVDRVEMAYARGLVALLPEHLAFAAVHPTGFYGRLPTTAVVDFLDRTEARWANEGGERDLRLRARAVEMLARLRPRPMPRSARAEPTCYLLASPNNLTKPALIRSILSRERARFVCLVHDLIPLEYPEYARPDGARLHRRRVETIARLADGVIGNSHATLASLQPWLARAGRSPATAVAHLGVDLLRADPFPAPERRPYFVCVATIEPRKNHLLLLHLWRQMSEAGGAANVPKLILIGRRGWENEQVVDLLERCPALVGCVEERGGLPDRAVTALVAGARALLLPSFAEGYGMPVTEALALGTPVVCSDTAALREAGGDVPCYLDPLDGPAWARAIADLTTDASGLRRAQLDRLAHWTRPSWTDHLAILIDLLHRIAA